MVQIHANVSRYVHEQLKEMSRSRLSKWKRLLYETTRLFVNDFDSESNAKYRRINFRLIFYFARIIHVNVRFEF